MNEGVEITTTTESVIVNIAAGSESVDLAAASAAAAAASAAAAAASASSVVIPPVVTQAEAEAGTETAARMWTPQRDAQAIDAHVTAILTRIYPVGSIYITASPDTPADTFGFGSWAQIEGRFIAGHKVGDTDFGTIHATGGTKTETLTNAQAPSHNHTQAAHRHHLPGGDSFITYDPQKQGAWYMSAGGGHEAGMASHTAYETPTIHSTGGGQSHNNLPPYAVFNIWERTA